VIPASSTQLSRWEERVSATDWDSVRADLDAYGCGLTGPPWRVRDPVRSAVHTRSCLPRRRLMASTAGTVPEPGGRTYTLLDANRRLYRSAVPGRFGGHRRSRIYGRLDCPAALRAIVDGGYAAHRVFFADERTAVAAGYRPCAVCLPGAYAAWKAR
jgi:Metal binding domain of Ada